MQSIVSNNPTLSESDFIENHCYLQLIPYVSEITTFAQCSIWKKELLKEGKYSGYSFNQKNDKTKRLARKIQDCDESSRAALVAYGAYTVVLGIGEQILGTSGTCTGIMLGAFVFHGINYVFNNDYNVWYANLAGAGY